MKLRSAFAVLALVVAWEDDAGACGGFFCNRSQPVDQVGEQILFILDEGHVTTHVQVRYEGPAEEFSWVIPVSTLPSIAVGTADLFPLLDGGTRPYAWMQSRASGCETFDGSEPPWYTPRVQTYCGGYPQAGADGSGDRNAFAGDVRVLASDIVGPYETVTVESEDPEALQAWLRDNGYDVPAEAEPLIASYVDAGRYFVGLKLTKDSQVGDLQPIVLDQNTDEACVPLRLTAIAAELDMPVTIWIVADGRAVSTNFPDVELDDVLIHAPGDWTYDTLVARAVDAVGGRGFVTESVGASWPLLREIDTSRFAPERFRSLVDSAAVLDELTAQGFVDGPTLRSVLLADMPPPDWLGPDAYYSCPSRWTDLFEEFPELGELPVPDVDALADDLEARIVVPMRGVERLVASHTHLTRLTTRISPVEMIEDPVFVVNTSLPLVDRSYDACQTDDCNGAWPDEKDTRSVVTEAGHRFTRRCGDPSTFDVPPLERAVQYGASGPGRVLVDNGSTIDAALATAGGARPSRASCSVVGGDGASGLALLVIGVALADRARRSRGNAA